MQALQVLACCRYCLAARKADLVKYGRKLLKDDVSFWRDAEVISEVLGLAEDTEHRGDILLDIEEKFSDTQVCTDPAAIDAAYMLLRLEHLPL